MAYDDGIKIGPVAYIGAVSAILTVAIILMLQVLYFQVRNSAEQAELAGQGPPPQLTELISAQQTELTRRGFVDRERGVVAVGVSEAKDLVLQDLGSGKSPAEANGPTAPVAAVDESTDQPGKEPTEGTGDSEENSADTNPDAGTLEAEKDVSKPKGGGAEG
jgi:hypothetical protein